MVYFGPVTKKQISTCIRQRLKKTGDHFVVTTKSERSTAIQEGALLKRYGLIEIQVVSHKNSNGTFNIMAV